MAWIIHNSVAAQAPLGIAWAKQFVSQFDESDLDWVRIDLGRGRCNGVYGRCWYPQKAGLYRGRQVKSKRCRISCQVPGPFPYSIRIRKPPLYRDPATGHFPPIPDGCRHGGYYVDMRSGVKRDWIRVLGSTAVKNMDEGIVWIMAHECFHWLRKTKQIPGRNTEIQADAYADALLADFRQTNT